MPAGTCTHPGSRMVQQGDELLRLCDNCGATLSRSTQRTR